MFARFWRTDWVTISVVSRMALPISATALAESGLFAASALMMGWLGHLELAAHGIVLQLAAMTFMVHMGLAQAGTVRVGKAFARQEWDAVRLTAKVSISLSTVFAIITMACFFGIPNFLIGIFLDHKDPFSVDILRIGTLLLIFAALFQLVDGAQVIALSILRGMQDTRSPMIIAAVSYWLIGLPIGYVLGFIYDFKEVGIWLGLVVGLLVAAVLLWARFVILVRN